MKILCVFGEYNYGNPSRGQSYEFTNFIPALRNLGYQVEIFDTLNRSSHSDFSCLNQELLERIKKLRPDIIFCALLGYEIWLETLELIHKAGIKLINWGTDDSWKYEQFTRYMAPAFDLWATTSCGAWQKSKSDGIKSVVLSQWGAMSATLTEPLSAENCRYQISFIGSAYGNRPRWINELKKRGINVMCFGYGWPNGTVSAEEIPKIIRESVVSLNFGDSGLHFQGLLPYRSRQIKARVFEVPGAGGCLLTESAENLEKYYLPGTEIEVFKDVNELEEKIRFLISHPKYRDSIARAGYVRTKREHTYEIRFRKLLDEKLKTSSNTNIRDSIDFEKFYKIKNKYNYGFLLKLLRRAILIPCFLVWGKRRGPRAARRIIYELSWRILGRKTYTACGIPGRIFYKES